MRGGRASRLGGLEDCRGLSVGKTLRAMLTKKPELNILRELFWSLILNTFSTTFLSAFIFPVMPGPIDEGRPNKRKSTSSYSKPIKRARSEDSEDDALAPILLLEHEIAESKKNYNNIAKLIKILRSDGGDDSSLAAISLCRVFTRLMATGDMAKGKDSTEKDLVVLRWLKERYVEYKATLLVLLGEDDADSTPLTLCMRLLKTEGTFIKNGSDYSFPTAFLAEIVQVLLQSESGSSVRREFSEKYVEENDDVRFYTFEAIE